MFGAGNESYSQVAQSEEIGGGIPGSLPVVRTDKLRPPFASIGAVTLVTASGQQLLHGSDVELDRYRGG